MCTKRTGGDHIVSGPAFGVGNADCSDSPLVRGSLFALTQCLDDMTVYAKVFDSEDSGCTGDLTKEVLMFPGGTDAGGVCALGQFKDGRKEYYR